MKKQMLYTYVGTNGTFTTPIHIENVACIKLCKLVADDGCKLTKDGKNYTAFVTVPIDDVGEWSEVKA